MFAYGSSRRCPRTLYNHAPPPVHSPYKPTKTPARQVGRRVRNTSHVSPPRTESAVTAASASHMCVICGFCGLGVALCTTWAKFGQSRGEFGRIRSNWARVRPVSAPIRPTSTRMRPCFGLLSKHLSGHSGTRTEEGSVQYVQYRGRPWASRKFV